MRWNTSVETIQQIGRKTEELGLASVWVSDHIIIPLWMPYRAAE